MRAFLYYAAVSFVLACVVIAITGGIVLACATWG